MISLINRGTYKKLSKMALGKIGSGIAGIGMLASLQAAEAQEVKLASAEGINNPVIAQIVKNFKTCVEAAATRTKAVKKESLRSRFFAKKVKNCKTNRDTEIVIAAENIKQAQLDGQIQDAQTEQAQLNAEISAITDREIARIKNDLGI